MILLLATAALADAPAAERWIASDDVAIGLHADGSLVNPDIGLGLLWDPDGASGPMPIGGDVLIQGYPFEAWSLTWSGGRVVNGGPHLDSDVVFEWEFPDETSTIAFIRGTADTPDAHFELLVAAPFDTPIVWFDLAVTANRDLDGLAAARSFDADFDAYVTGAYQTLNEGGDGWGASEGLHDARALALAVVGGTGGICSWCTTAAEIAAGSAGPVQSDAVVGVGVNLGDLAAGESTVVTFAYGLAVGTGDAVDLAIQAAGSDDFDDDGYPRGDDCDDLDPWVAPDAPEIADYIDNDCDGEIDEGTALSDDDDDGFTEIDGDCDDGDDRVHPGAATVDGVADADCDGVTDAGWPPQADPDLQVESPGGCACTAGGLPASPALFTIALLIPALSRRRR